MDPLPLAKSASLAGYTMWCNDQANNTPKMTKPRALHKHK